MRLTLLKFLIIVSLFFISGSIFAAEHNHPSEKLTDINEGIEYESLDSPQPVSNKNKIQVIEFFSYACPHCANLEPNVEDWEKHKKDDIEFIRVPAIFNKNWEAFAGIFYTAEALDVVEKVHPIIFNAIHGTGKKIRSLDDVKAIFVDNGVKPSDFDNTVNSFGVDNKTRKAKQMTTSYDIKSVPMIVINGKYRTNSTLAHGHDNVFKVVKHITDKERKLSK